MIYLATPYTGKCLEDTGRNYTKALHVRYKLMKNFGMQIYSPIVENHFTARTFDMPTDAKHWEEYNKGMIDISDGLLLDLTSFTEEDYKQSLGCQVEIKYAKENNIKVYAFQNNEITLIYD